MCETNQRDKEVVMPYNKTMQSRKISSKPESIAKKTPINNKIFVGGLYERVKTCPFAGTMFVEGMRLKNGRNFSGAFNFLLD